MGFFDRPLFDLNGDGKEDGYDTFISLQMTASSRQEAIALTGDDTFYFGGDEIEKKEEIDVDDLDELDLDELDLDELDLDELDLDELDYDGDY